MIKAIVGAGGKTSLIKRLAKEYVEQGKKVLVTTSTHMFVESDTLLSDNAREIIARLDEYSYAMAGIPAGEKIKALSESTYLEVCERADVVLIEADGSKHLPIKYPTESEPVIYENVDGIVVVCGLHALGREMRDAAHRLELVKKCLSVSDYTIVSPEHIQKLVMEGYVKPLREKYPEKKITIEPNHDGSLYQKVIARMIADEQDVSVIKKEWFEPQPQLVVCGGGHVAYDLVQMASRLDFYIKVIDDREQFANEERFPWADEVICDSFKNLDNHLDDHGYYVVVTRGHMADYDCVKTIISKEYHYLGMIGSKAKVAATFDKLRAESVGEDKIKTIHAPIGLDIKARTPAEIAISILAEIIQEKNRRYLSFVSRELLNVREKGVLCIITEKKGSAPRGAGSMMFVGENGTIDTIGGGAVEMAAIKDAKNITKAVEKEYLLDSSESAQLGMICGGSNKVLFVPIN